MALRLIKRRASSRLVGSFAVAAACAVLWYAPRAAAEVHLPNVLTDHAVLQRDRPIHIWGTATPGAHLAAALHAQTAYAVANSAGEWSLYLAPEPAGGPYTLSINGDGEVKVLSDVLVGDVWFASGQSNMEMPLMGFPPSAHVKDADKEIAAAANPRLRLLVVEKKSSDFPLGDANGTWQQCTPATARMFSAVAYFFGRRIAADQSVPVGLIDSTWGGTPADSWVSMNTLGSDPRLLPAFAARADFADLQTDVDARKAAEAREDTAARAAGKPAPPHAWHPFEGSWLPAGLYNGMIAPYTPMTLRGFIWYQGETNSAHERAPYYADLFSALIGDWRRHFAQGELPFLYVQISSFSSPAEDWGRVRDAQRRTLAVAHTAMAVTLDIGDATNVHPADKQTVGDRLARAAEATVYNEPVAFSGPMFREATLDTSSAGRQSLRAWFNHADGLNSGRKPLAGFEIAGGDRHFVAADAVIDGASVRVSADAVPEPKFVRYGWSSVVDNYLYNAAGLPASTFTSEP